ncbi:hypothetical protein IscW_ISCW023584 [Ixodes scapularis]|uniref:Uncharacterized protein n=1 Tax=Ixodes scapularis TaxID=6945 RepID=B7QH73_IXOSC|nr:hypothetical protein IscW_ISCW023584 [Ixodes scapularis]|eukprot:XP_002414530.1 hypothetical protein IscW_ISCW023584 [Ixodes scapularis]
MSTELSFYSLHHVQFQSFSQFRSNVNKKTAEEIEVLNQNPKIWNVHSVLNVLHSLVDKSNINLQLEVYTKGGDPDNVAGEFGRHPLYKMLGYFSLIGLLRLHSLLGDYYQAIKVLENLELNKKSLYSRVPACQITTYYYVGFAYLMMRRYADAIRTFSNILVYIQRTKHMFQQRSYQVDQHKMKNVVWTKGSSSLDGEFQSGSDVDFFIDGDMIHIADTKVARRYGDFYIRQYHKFEELYRTLSSLQA